MKTIALYDALGEMDLGIPFQLKYVTADRNRKTGGKFIELPKCVKVGSTHSHKNNNTITVKQLDNNSHPYPVHIHLIVGFNHKKVFI